MFKYLFRRDTILATIMVFLVMGLLSLIPFNTHVLDPIKMALQDFDYNDLAYSQFDKNGHTSVDTNIVVVNIEDGNRAEITAMLEKIMLQKPAVVGVDVVFNEPKDPVTDAALTNLFTQHNNIVLAYNLSIEKDKTAAEGFLYPKAKQKGYANFVGEEGGSIRHFAPVIKKEEEYISFSAAIMKIADIKKYEQLIARHHSTEPINYSRSADKYILLSGRDIMEMDMSAISLAGKTVLVGYVANDLNIEDKHFTPLNKKSVGKSVPDMPGVFIHANIISMVKSGDYVSKWPGWMVWTLAVLLCWLHMSLFIRYFIDKHIWFHLVAKIAQVLSAVLIVYLGLLFFYKWDIKINLTPTFVAIILAVDVLYFYEALVAWLHKKFGFHSLFVHHAH